MKVDQAGIDFIKQFEGFRPTVYADCRGRLTIGWGHTEGVTAGTPPVTQGEAEIFLEDDLRVAEEGVTRLVEIQLSQPEFNALVSFAFNEGVHRLWGSTLLTRLNAGDRQAAARQFDRWIYYEDPKTKKMLVSTGLKNRRTLEKALFLSDFNAIRRI